MVSAGQRLEKQQVESGQRTADTGTMVPPVVTGPTHLQGRPLGTVPALLLLLLLSTSVRFLVVMVLQCPSLALPAAFDSKF